VFLRLLACLLLLLPSMLVMASLKSLLSMSLLLLASLPSLVSLMLTASSLIFLDFTLLADNPAVAGLPA
jgi:hypothetical protein